LPCAIPTAANACLYVPAYVLGSQFDGNGNCTGGAYQNAGVQVYGF
jgi:hypothetical protein